MIGTHQHRSPMVQSDVVLPAQFFDLLRKRSPIQGERRLMIAILEDAVNCIQKHLSARRSNERQLYQEARAWMLSDNADPFSFQHICDVVGLDPAYVRDGIERWCRRQLAPAAERPSMDSTRGIPSLACSPLDRCRPPSPRR